MLMHAAASGEHVMFGHVMFGLNAHHALAPFKEHMGTTTPLDHRALRRAPTFQLNISPWRQRHANPCDVLNQTPPSIAMRP